MKEKSAYSIWTTVIVATCSLVGHKLVWGCEDGYSSTSFGVCLPNCSGNGCDEIEKAKREAIAQIAGRGLAAWLVQSRNNALSGSSPIPPNIRNALRGYIGDNLMDKVRYKVGDNGVFNLADLSLTYGDAKAITLIDVVVFGDSSSAISPALWAHELTHVRQFAEWGVDDFSIRYCRNFNTVEDPAYETQNNYSKWWSSTHPATNLNGIQIQSLPYGTAIPLDFGK